MSRDIISRLYEARLRFLATALIGEGADRIADSDLLNEAAFEISDLRARLGHVLEREGRIIKILDEHRKHFAEVNR